MAKAKKTDEFLEFTTSLNKKYGKGIVWQLDEVSEPAASISTGSFCLDLASGIGGVPKGRTVEIFGGESSGKTTLALAIAANAQKEGGNVLYIDTEYAFDPKYAKALGIDISKILVSQPGAAEDALDIADQAAASGKFACIILDSVAALVPRAELEGEMGDSHMGLQARLMGQAMRKLTGSIAKSETCMLFINQKRMKIGRVFGNPETTTGGLSLKYFASMRLELSQKEAIKDKTGRVGTITKAKVVKNKMAPPFKEAFFEIVFGKGISYVGEILDTATEQKILQKEGSWYSYKGEKLGQGRNQMKDLLESKPELVAELKAAILSTDLVTPDEEEQIEDEVA